jgi:predicted HTH transcriptional regulator
VVFPDAWIQCGRFIGKDRADIFDHIDIHEHLPVAVERVMEFLKKHAMRGADFSELRRKDVWSIPLTILREAVVNAIVHADYSQRGAPVRIAFFNDRIEIENPGILLPGLTVEDMLQGVSRIHNHVIARVFRELDLIEQWGSGVRRVFREAEALGLPQPEIIEVGMRVRFIVYLAESVVLPYGMRSSRDQVGTKLKLNKEQIKVLHACVNESGITELMSVTKRSNRTKFRNQVLSPLLSNELIEMAQPYSPKSPTQKYRMTAKGNALLATQRQGGIE